jgi:hypothetical protein
MEESAPTTESSPSILTDGPQSIGQPDPTASILDGSLPLQESNPLAFDPGALPDELRYEPSLQNFDSVDKLAKSYIHARKMIGADPDGMIQLPKEGDEDSWNQFYNKIGRPESPDQYDFELGDGEQADDVADFKNVAHQLGLTNDQAGAILGIYNQLAEGEIAQEDEEFDQMNVEYLQEIQQEWGDDFNKNAELARRGFNSFASEGAVEVLRETGLANHPEILKTFARIGQAFSEDNVLPGTRGAIGAMSPVHAEETISSKMADPEFKKAYLDGTHPNHAQAVQEMTRLHNALS